MLQKQMAEYDEIIEIILNENESLKINRQKNIIV